MKREAPPSSSQQQSKRKATATSAAAAGDAAGPGEGSEFVCRLKYLNRLPPAAAASEAKMLAVPLDAARLSAYRGSDVELLYRHPLRLPRDLCLPSDLALVLAASPDLRPFLQQQQQQQQQKIDAEDEELLTWAPPAAETAQQQQQQAAATATTATQQLNTAALRPQVSWLRRPELLEAETVFKRRERSLQQQAPLTADAAAEGGSGGAAAEAESTAEEEAAAAAEQIRAIEETFEIARSTVPVNARDPAMAAVEVLPVLPAFDLWPNDSCLVAIEGDAALATRRALVKGFVTSENDRLVAFLAPQADTQQQQQQQQSGVPEREAFRWVRSFKYQFSGADEVARHALVIDREGARYFPLGRRVTLSKLRDRQLIENVRKHPIPARITAVRVELTDEERAVREEAIEDLLRPAADAELLRRADAAAADASDAPK